MSEVDMEFDDEEIQEAIRLSMVNLLGMLHASSKKSTFAHRNCARYDDYTAIVWPKDHKNPGREIGPPKFPMHAKIPRI